MPSAQSICHDLQKVSSRIPISTVSQRLCLSMCSGLHITLRQTSPTFLDVFIASQAKYNNACSKLQPLLQRLSQNELVTSVFVSLVRLIFIVIMAKSCQMLTCVFLFSKVTCQDLFHSKPLRCAMRPLYTLFPEKQVFQGYVTSTVSHLDTTQEYGHGVPWSCQFSLPTSPASNHPCPPTEYAPCTNSPSKLPKVPMTLENIQYLFKCQTLPTSIPKYQRKRIQRN